jgi:hypothetical protein
MILKKKKLFLFINYITPSKVTEVSAILVATIHFLNSEASKILDYSSYRS